jgi:hypothetical protein
MDGGAARDGKDKPRMPWFDCVSKQTELHLRHHFAPGDKDVGSGPTRGYLTIPASRQIPPRGAPDRAVQEPKGLFHPVHAASDHEGERHRSGERC